MTNVSRRQALGGAAIIGAGGPLLAACGGPGGGSTGAVPKAGTELAKTSDVPVGGGLIIADKGVILAQPKKGTFKAFSNICTHQRCPITQLAGDKVTCSCHGSEFSTADGSVLRGPATQPLMIVDIKVKGSAVDMA